MDILNVGIDRFAIRELSWAGSGFGCHTRLAIHRFLWPLDQNCLERDRNRCSRPWQCPTLSGFDPFAGRASRRTCSVVWPRT